MILAFILQVSHFPSVYKWKNDTEIQDILDGYSFVWTNSLFFWMYQFQIQLWRGFHCNLLHYVQNLIQNQRVQSYRRNSKFLWEKSLFRKILLLSCVRCSFLIIMFFHNHTPIKWNISIESNIREANTDIKILVSIINLTIKVM